MTTINTSAAPTVDDCQIVQLPRVDFRQGNITAVDSRVEVPFDIRRIFYLYDIPGGIGRGGHGHRELQKLLIAVMGSFDVILDDGEHRRTVTLNRAYYGLYVPRLVWGELVNFSSGAVCLVLASEPYDEGDYFRSYEEFLTHRKELRA